MKTAFIIIVTLFFNPILKADEVLLSEESIINALEKNPPSVEMIKAKLLNSRLDESSLNEQFAYQVEASGSRVKSKEKSLSSFIPVTSRYEDLSLGIVKPTQYGVKLGARAFVEQSTNNFLTDATTSGVAVSMSLDLYKDFLGRLSSANVDKKSLTSKRAQLESEISIKAFETQLRKLYWSLVANEESLKITQAQLSLSQKQLKDVIQRNKSGVADRGEVARNRSQLASRKAAILSLKYQRSQILRALKQYLPEFSNKKIKLAPYNVDKALGRVLECTSIISKFNEAPMDFTAYDDIVKLLSIEEAHDRKMANSHDSIDLKLMSEYKSTGKAFDYSDSIEDFNDDGRSSVSVGLQLVIPLGSQKKNTREIREEVLTRSYKARKEENLSKVIAFHTETVESIKLLNQVIARQAENSKYLSISLKSSKKKYKQARLTLQELINEQNSHLQSNLDEIATKQEVINILLDYFSVYTTIPCELNVSQKSI